jgi:RecJ-like exonuclease
MTKEEIAEAFRQCVLKCPTCKGIGYFPVLMTSGEVSGKSECYSCGSATSAIKQLEKEGITESKPKHYGMLAETGKYIRPV